MGIFGGLGGQARLHKKLVDGRERLHRMALVWTRDPDLAMDLVQETIGRALDKHGQLRDCDNFDAWLYRILNNAWLDHLRKRRDTCDVDDLDLADERSPERICQQSQLVDQVRCAIARLPKGQRQVVTLVDLEEFSYKTVAEILEIPIGTVMSRLCRARNALKALLLTPSGSQETAKVSHLKRIK